MFKNILVRLVLYYTVVILFMAALPKVFPVLAKYAIAERVRSEQIRDFDLGGGDAASAGDPAEVLIGLEQLYSPQATIPLILAMLGVLLFSVPLAWVYQWTTPRKQFNRSFMNMILSIPLAIAAVVFLVKGSLALAFSLAGIVAAVRFRSSLSSSMDAVYMLVAIAIGLAAGVQLPAVGILTSVVFNIVVLTAWKLNLGVRPVTVSGWTLVDTPPLPAGSTFEDDASRISILRIGTRYLTAAQDAIVPILDEGAKRWKLLRSSENPDGSFVLEYELRLRKSTERDVLVQDLKSTSRVLESVTLDPAPRPTAS